MKIYSTIASIIIPTHEWESAKKQFPQLEKWPICIEEGFICPLPFENAFPETWHSSRPYIDMNEFMLDDFDPNPYLYFFARNGAQKRLQIISQEIDEKEWKNKEQLAKKIGFRNYHEYFEELASGVTFEETLLEAPTNFEIKRLKDWLIAKLGINSMFLN